MTTITQTKSAKGSMAVVIDSDEPGSPSTQSPSLSSDLMLVALEYSDHTFRLDECSLPGSAAEKLKGLKTWRTSNWGRWQKFVAHVMCKKPYIAVGTLGVRLVSMSTERVANSTIANK